MPRASTIRFSTRAVISRHVTTPFLGPSHALPAPPPASAAPSLPVSWGPGVQQLGGNHSSQQGQEGQVGHVAAEAGPGAGGWALTFRLVSGL